MILINGVNTPTGTEELKSALYGGISVIFEKKNAASHVTRETH